MKLTSLLSFSVILIYIHLNQTCLITQSLPETMVKDKGNSNIFRQKLKDI